MMMAAGGPELLEAAELEQDAARTEAAAPLPTWAEWAEPDPAAEASADEPTVVVDVDAAGNLVSVTDPLGNTTTYAYDAAGNPVSVTDPNGDTTTFAYDADLAATGEDDDDDELPSLGDLGKGFVKHWLCGLWLFRGIANAPETIRQAGEELGELYGSVKNAEIDSKVLERRIRDLKTPEDYKRVFGDQWREAMAQTARLAKIGVHAELIVGGMVVRPGTIMASGCDDVATEIQKIVGGKAVKITPKRGITLGAFAGQPNRWSYHRVIVSNGRVYDSYTGLQGMLIDEYKKLWENSSQINFSSSKFGEVL